MKLSDLPPELFNLIAGYCNNQSLLQWTLTYRKAHDLWYLEQRSDQYEDFRFSKLSYWASDKKQEAELNLEYFIEKYNLKGVKNVLRFYDRKILSNKKIIEWKNKLEKLPIPSLYIFTRKQIQNRDLIIRALNYEVSPRQTAVSEFLLKLSNEHPCVIVGTFNTLLTVSVCTLMYLLLD